MSIVGDFLEELRTLNDNITEFVKAYREANEIVYLPGIDDDDDDIPQPGLYHPEEGDEKEVLSDVEVLMSLASKDPRYGWTVFDDDDD
jgi:hypothetical protein